MDDMWKKPDAIPDILGYSHVTVWDSFQIFSRDIKSSLEAKSNETQKETWLFGLREIMFMPF